MGRRKKDAEIVTNVHDIFDEIPESALSSSESFDEYLASLASIEILARIKSGTASDGLLIEVMKKTSGKDKMALENERLRKENKLLEAKTRNLDRIETDSDLTEKAIEVFTGKYMVRGDRNAS